MNYLRKKPRRLLGRPITRAEKSSRISTLCMGGHVDSYWHRSSLVTSSPLSEIGGVLQPLWVLAAQVVLRQALDFLEELSAVLIEAASELVGLVGNSDSNSQYSEAFSCL